MGQFVSSCANLFTCSLQKPHPHVNRGGTAFLSASVTNVDDHATMFGISIFRAFTIISIGVPKRSCSRNPLISTNNRGSSHPCSRQYRVNGRQVIKR